MIGGRRPAVRTVPPWGGTDQLALERRRLVTLPLIELANHHRQQPITEHSRELALQQGFEQSDRPAPGLLDALRRLEPEPLPPLEHLSVRVDQGQVIGEVIAI